MKKQFFRVKQLADQTFSRAGKTEVLSDDLQAADKRVEFIRVACQNTSKKLSGSLQTQGQDATAKEKRLKKNADYQLGIAMLESGNCEEDCLLRTVISECGKLEMCLANACVDHEARVETGVLATLQTVVESDIPTIMKHKRHLNKLILDMDSARTRYQTAQKHNNYSQGNKVESIRDELEEAETKVEQCRDTLACEMFQLMARETELATTVLEYARLQRSYHQTAMATLDEMIPELESNILDWSVKPVFGVSLEEHLRVTGRKIAYPIELCVCALSVLAMDEEGLFRVAGGASKIKRMKLSLDANCLSLETALEYRDPHVIASVLKSYLRQLPEPLMTYRLHDQWIAAAKAPNDTRLQALWSVVQQLPTANLDNLRYLVKFLALLSQNQEVNKMTPQNIAIVVAPNLLWSPNDDGNNIGMNMNTASLHSIILDSLVTYSDYFFPGEYNMFVTFTRDQVVNGHTRAGSGDTHLINTADSGMKRTQSNSSLSEDQSSPPQGSPKPMSRNRKNKPAPVPPSNPPKDTGKEASSSRDSGKETNRGGKKETNCDTKKGPLSNYESVMLLKECKNSEDSSQSATAPVVENPSQVFIGFERLVVEKTPEVGDKKQEDKEKKGEEEEKKVETIQGELKSVIGTKEENLTQRSSAESTPLRPPEPVKPPPKPEKPEFRGSAELVYGTLERKRPPRPTPAPRTSLVEHGEKPAIPERPTTLQRPLSSSFRHSRNLEMDSDKCGDQGPVSLERAHVYSVDKQQVSIIQVTGDKESRIQDWFPTFVMSLVRFKKRKDSGEKPERPPKPEALAVTHNPGHKRTASEGNIVDNGTGPLKSPVNPSRPPRPMPPPPPTPKARESTDL
ncbi:rho GTPase-activating protein 44-like isoform X1 [Macrosteles quadrilineatus]|uniref:rho GTPase-activating protein 44-like isoform X1 n=1 Tax=Macrosteles quadrilineatus TaxID=74068 RepID=UPI0023E2E45E|nr:rho GTPase-activating protein 44-like isoform X1 [Macrosteles quadrilineatus]